MKKEKAAQNIYDLLFLYNDYIEYGFKRSHNTPVFSFSQTHEKPTETDNGNELDIEENNRITKIKKDEIILLAENILHCEKCNLHKNAKKVPGAGNVNSKILVISHSPSSNEEALGRPLVGKEGSFFKKWMEAIDINIEEIFITNLLKCPPKNNKLTKENIQTCIDHLDEQIRVLKPKIILSLGQLTLSSLKKSFIDIKHNHGQIFYYNNIPFIPTFHPTDVLNDPAIKKTVWSDLKIFQQFLRESIVNE